MNKRIIISLTSYGDRMKFVPKTVYSILKQTYKNTHIVLTLYKDEINKIPEDLKSLIDNNIVELLVADENLKSHLKYFYCMQKYNNDFIITIDDDFLYNEKMIEELVNAYEDGIIVGHGGHKLNKKCIYTQCDSCIKNEISILNLPLGAMGVLYPPNCLKFDDNTINEIKTILHNDDVYLKVLGIRNNVKVKILNTSLRDKYIEIKTGEDNLHTLNWKGRTQIEMNFFKKDFEKIFK